MTLFAEGDGRFTEYAGGYADMMTQRGSGIAARSVGKPASAPKSEAVPAMPKAAARKLSFKDKHALETLPATIAKLEQDIAALQDRLSAPDLYTKDATRFATLSADLGARQAELAAAEDRWLELEMLKSELGG
jgi:ATP-binding cassette subfamily F protein uup